MLPFPSRVKYINRTNKEPRIFASRVSDHQMYEVILPRPNRRNDEGDVFHNVRPDPEEASEDL